MSESAFMYEVSYIQNVDFNAPSKIREAVRASLERHRNASKDPEMSAAIEEIVEARLSNDAVNGVRASAIEDTVSYEQLDLRDHTLQYLGEERLYGIIRQIFRDLGESKKMITSTPPPHRTPPPIVIFLFVIVAALALALSGGQTMAGGSSPPSIVVDEEFAFMA